MTIYVVTGTSIEDGSHLPNPATQAWPQRVAARAGVTILDRALGGGCWLYPNSAGQTIRSVLDASLAADHPNTVIIGGPVNDFVHTTDQEAINWAIQHGIDACHAAGVTKVILGGCLPFNDGGAFAAGWWPRLEGMRSAYNSWAAAAASEPGVAYAGDLAAYLTDPASGTTRCDGRWYSDGLHPNTVGTAIIAETWPINLL